VWCPDETLIVDWGVQGGLHVFCAVLAWSRFRFVRFAADEKAATTFALLADCFEVSNWKSAAQTLFGASAIGGFGVVVVPVRLRRRRCGTRSPSSRQSRWIFLWFTAQPSARASWWALRNPRRGWLFAHPRSQARSAASGSAVVVASGGVRCVLRFCPVTRQANRSLTFMVFVRW
jgi:hypothetical protein